MVECSRMTISAFQEQVHKSYLDNLHFPLNRVRSNYDDKHQYPHRIGHVVFVLFMGDCACLLRVLKGKIQVSCMTVLACSRNSPMTYDNNSR